MAYSPRVVANALIRKALEQGEKLSHLKLQKLVFFAHGWHLATTGQPLIEDKVQAWPYGPVIPSLYHELKHFGSRGIESYLQEPDLKTGQLVALFPSPADQHAWYLIDYVWRRYGPIGAIDLSNMTHQQGSPWWAAREEGDTTIPQERIRDYFVREAEAASRAQRELNG